MISPDVLGATGEPEAENKPVDQTLNDISEVKEEVIPDKVLPLPEEPTPKIFELTEDECKDLEKNKVLQIKPTVEDDDDDDDDDEDNHEDDMFIDESLTERLWGLTEMFPSTLRNATHTSIYTSANVGVFAFQVSKTALWVVATSFAILALPVLFESERSTVEQQQLAQQRQILLGPSAAGNALQPTTNMMPHVTPPSN